LKLLFALLVSTFALTLLGADQSAGSSPVVVHIASFAFDPADLTVHVGDTVTFINDDNVAHTATASDKSFDSGNLDQNAKWSHTFNTAGTFPYACAYHSMMKGTITVKPAP